ncbi:MAG TPA: PIG-L family deacetylase, partial [Streptosporangiaceae bacterium]|nr:PIG-L family deacetylase [Streptosporangiaceae bacterium]
MATLVSFHAHPDDECIACGGVIRKASEEGHRVVLVVATRGERGEVPDGFLADGEELWQRRVAETHASAEISGQASACSGRTWNLAVMKIIGLPLRSLATIVAQRARVTLGAAC